MTAAQARTLVPFDVLVDSVTGGVVTVKRNRILFGVELISEQHETLPLRPLRNATLALVEARARSSPAAIGQRDPGES